MQKIEIETDTSERGVWVYATLKNGKGRGKTSVIASKFVSNEREVRAAKVEVVAALFGQEK